MYLFVVGVVQSNTYLNATRFPPHLPQQHNQTPRVPRLNRPRQPRQPRPPFQAYPPPQTLQPQPPPTQNSDVRSDVEMVYIQQTMPELTPELTPVVAPLPPWIPHVLQVDGLGRATVPLVQPSLRLVISSADEGLFCCLAVV